MESIIFKTLLTVCLLKTLGSQIRRFLSSSVHHPRYHQHLHQHILISLFFFPVAVTQPLRKDPKLSTKFWANGKLHFLRFSPQLTVDFILCYISQPRWWRKFWRSYSLNTIQVTCFAAISLTAGSFLSDFFDRLLPSIIIKVIVTLLDWIKSN